MKQSPAKPFHRFEDFQGRLSLRYATADLMRSGCVDCHNTHPETPKNDWNVGDVRGVLEIVHPVDSVFAQIQSELRGTFILIGAMSGLGLLVLALVIGKLHRTSAGLEEQVEARTAALVESNKKLEAEIIERKQAEEALREAERVHVLMETAGAAAHEINQPLTVIIGISQLILKMMPSNDSHRDNVEEIKKAGQKVNEIVRRMGNIHQYATKPYGDGTTIVDFDAAALKK